MKQIKKCILGKLIPLAIALYLIYNIGIILNASDGAIAIVLSFITIIASSACVFDREIQKK